MDKGNYNLLRRIPIIHRTIASNSYPNKNTLRRIISEELRDKELSVSTIGNDIEFLRNECNAPIEFDFSQNGYYYSEPNFQLQLYKSTSQVDADNFEKEAFAKHIGVDISVINNLEKYTRLGIEDESILELCLDRKWCGRYYYNRNLWIGIKVFGNEPNYRLCVAIYEGYNQKPKSVTAHLQANHLNYISEDEPIDEGYWHYVMFDSDLLQADEALAKFSFKRLVKLMWEYREVTG